MSGTILPYATRASKNVPYFQPFGTGGGSTNPDPQFSTITVASTATFQGDIDGQIINASTINAPELINVSTVNGSVYPPAASVPANLSLSTLTINNSGSIALGSAALTAAGTNIVNDTVATGSGTFSTITADPGGAGSVSTRTVNGETFSCSTISCLTSADAPTVNATTVNGQNANVSSITYNNGVQLIGQQDSLADPILLYGTKAVSKSFVVPIAQGTIPATASVTSTIFQTFSTLRNATYRIEMPLSFQTTDANGVVYFTPTNAFAGANGGAIDNLKSTAIFGCNAQTVTCVWKAQTDDCRIDAFQIGNSGTSAVTVSCLDTGAVLTCLGSNVL